MTAAREGFTTGVCAAAAAQAAIRLAVRKEALQQVTVPLPGGEQAELAVASLRPIPGGAEAAVRKDAGDDPDVTHGADVVVRVELLAGTAIELCAGSGVGTVTRPGLAVPPGQPAINPVPRRMLREAIRRVTDQGVRVTVSIPGGEALARKTCNPRLGVRGGLSILGSSGRVRPFSTRALLQTVSCGFQVAAACGVQNPVLVPGHLGERAARAHFRLSAEQVIEVGNAWGFALDQVRTLGCGNLLLLGHPGKLGKLCQGDWDTHSKKAPSPLPEMQRWVQDAGHDCPESPTVEGLFEALPARQRRSLAAHVCAGVRERVAARVGERWAISVALIDLQEALIGSLGELWPWT